MDAWVIEDRIHRFLVAVHHVEYAVGQPRLLNNPAMWIEAEGTFSEGFRMKVLPQAIAMGNIHSGTITGKLNG